jgi:hypothetical protein
VVWRDFLAARTRRRSGCGLHAAGHCIGELCGACRAAPLQQRHVWAETWWQSGDAVSRCLRERLATWASLRAARGGLLLFCAVVVLWWWYQVASANATTRESAIGGRGAVNSGARHGAIEVVGRRVLAAVVRMYSSLTSRGCSGRVVQRPHRGRGWFLAGASLVLRGDAMRSTCGACVLHTRAIPAAQTAAS